MVTEICRIFLTELRKAAESRLRRVPTTQPFVQFPLESVRDNEFADDERPPSQNLP